MSDRLPPHAPDAERGVLGCVLIDPVCFTDAAEVITEPEWFYDMRHQRIWRTMQTLASKGAFDLLTLLESLRTSGDLESVGGVQYVASLQDGVPSAANLPHYLDILREKLHMRRMLQACAQATAAIYESELSAGEILQRAQADVLRVTEAAAPRRERVLREYMDPLIEVLEEFSQGHKVMPGMATGFNYLDNMMGGWEQGLMYVISGRPSAGKTSLGVDILRHLAHQGIPAAFFSLEMTAMQVAMRILAAEAKISFLKFRNGFLANSQPARLLEATGRMVNMPIFIDDSPGLNGRDIMMRTRRMIAQHGIKAIVIDYIQFMGSVEKYREKRDRVAECSEWMKRIAKELQIPVIVLAQLNREVEKSNRPRRPMMSDLAECGDIEQDADFIGGLWRPQVDYEMVSKTLPLGDVIDQVERMSPSVQREWKWILKAEVDAEDPKRAWTEYLMPITLEVMKQRNGPTGECHLLFYREQMRFADIWKPR